MHSKTLLFTFVFLQYLIASSQTREVSLLFLGDIMGHGPQIKAAYQPENQTYNYESTFQYIKEILRKPDFTIANLEVTLGTKPYSGYPQFSSPPALASAIKEAGIDVLGTANNHSCDRGKKGIERTIKILDSLDIKRMGTYYNQQEKDTAGVLILAQNDIRIALVNYTYGTNGLPIPSPNIVNLLDKELIKKDLARAHSYKPDVIIAFVHWGSEYADLPSQEQKDWLDFFVSQGVSIVIGSHPHVVEPMLWHREKDRLVVYSMGNFVSNQRKPKTDGGTLFSLTLEKNDQNIVEIKQASYVLTWVYKYIHAGKTNYYVLPVEKFKDKKFFFAQESVYMKMMQFAQNVRKLLGKQNINVSEQKITEQEIKQYVQGFY